MYKIRNKKHIVLNIGITIIPILISIMIYLEYIANMKIIIGIGTISIIYAYGFMDIIIKAKKNNRMVNTITKRTLLAMWHMPTTIIIGYSLYTMIMILIFGRDIYEPGHIIYVSIIYAVMITIGKYKIIKHLMEN